MGTRMQIGFYENATDTVGAAEVLVYQHYDGDPGSTLPQLLPFLREFEAARGISDIEYAAAQTVAHLIELNRGPSSRFLGYGIGRTLHTDLDFFYRVNCDTAELIVYTSEDGAVIFGANEIERHDLKRWER